MVLLASLILILLAGMCNGSYPALMKRMAHINADLVWAGFSVWAFLLLPLAATSILVPHWWSLLHHLPPSFFWVSALGGFLFGLGMICFTIALRFIGIGIAFVFNISLGTVFGSLLPVFFRAPQVLLTPFGLLELLALVCFVLSVMLSAMASRTRAGEGQKDHSTQTGIHHTIGILMGILSGMLCAAQGAAFGWVTPILTAGVKSSALPSHILNLPWLLIFASAFIPYFLFYSLKALISLKLHIQRESKALLRSGLPLLFMGVLYYSALVIYSEAIKHLGAMANALGWPLLMASIILTSNFWGWRRHEWDGASKRAKHIMLFSIATMLMAVILLGLSARLNLTGGV